MFSLQRPQINQEARAGLTGSPKISSQFELARVLNIELKRLEFRVGPPKINSSINVANVESIEVV